MKSKVIIIIIINNDKIKEKLLSKCNQGFFCECI